MVKIATTARTFMWTGKALMIFMIILMGFTTTTVAATEQELQKDHQQERNDRPIIGIFTQPTSSTQGDCGGDCEYIAASYVKNLEAAGARVVPVNYYASKTELDALIMSLNGFFFPGGGAVFPSSAQYVFDQVKARNDAGDYLPLWGTCMGFQWLLISAAQDTSVLDPPSGQLDSYNLSIPLDFTASAPSSRLFNNAPEYIYQALSKENVTLNNHHYGIFPDHFDNVPALSEFYDVLSTNMDRQGVEFVSTIEAYKYPIFGTQWHPEKNIFEWQEDSEGIPEEAINHSFEAVAVSQYMANFFVQQTRRNFHKFDSEEQEDAALIYNFAAQKTSGSFVQEYFFHWK